ncbi:hypothetical protein ACFV6E_39545 [Streptomyces sp. NPDC059785]|uniref:hypothetical protein n=1 Tax=unclassified Streptomyces TaxID=2593676 RepID=UPI0036510662
MQPLYVPMDTWQASSGFRLGERTGHPLRPGFDTPEEGAESMRELAALVRTEALPHFERYGSPQGFLDWCRTAAAGHPVADRARLLRQQAATEVLLGQVSAALATLDGVSAVADGVPDPPDWLSVLDKEARQLSRLVREEGLEAARADLAQTETLMRTALGLPSRGLTRS